MHKDSTNPHPCQNLLFSAFFNHWKNWSIVNLQCFISTEKWLTDYIYVYIHTCTYSFSDSLSFCYYKIVNVVPCVIQSVLVVLFFDNSHPNAICSGIDGGNRVPKYDCSLHHSIFLCTFHLFIPQIHSLLLFTYHSLFTSNHPFISFTFPSVLPSIPGTLPGSVGWIKHRPCQMYLF